MGNPIIFSPKEENEERVSIIPSTISPLLKLGAGVLIEESAGLGCGFSDEEYKESGAKIVSHKEGLESADMVCALNSPKLSDIGSLKSGAIWISHLSPTEEIQIIKEAQNKKITLFSMNLIPRISRAQKMDSLSSQSALAGYKAVLLAANTLKKGFPLQMSAAGTLQPAKVVILGAGVAGLSAIATAKRLGAVVEASDVRPAAKEQVESLGAKFIEVPFDKDSEDKGGYAKEASPEFLKKQAEEVDKRLKGADVVITTALIMGRKAPILITKEQVKSMKKGSVIVDMASSSGGNCQETEAGKTVIKNGVTIIGETNLLSGISQSASELYSRNILAFLSGILKNGKVEINKADEVYSSSLVVENGEIISQQAKKAIEGAK